jgi:Tfp pilus assembly protein PilF
MGYLRLLMSGRRFCWLLMFMLLLPGCAMREISPPPSGPGPEPTAVSPAASPLLANARFALERNDPAGAEGYLERAIGIEPRNPLLWHTLAQAKYRQGDYAQTVQLCLRSNALLPQAQLRRDNFRLMAEAYRRLGQEDKARQASIQAGDS